MLSHSDGCDVLAVPLGAATRAVHGGSPGCVGLPRLHLYKTEVDMNLHLCGCVLRLPRFGTLSPIPETPTSDIPPKPFVLTLNPMPYIPQALKSMH